MRSSVSLGWQIFVTVNTLSCYTKWNMSSLTVERKVERKTESFRHTCSTTLNYRSTLSSNVEKKIEGKIESFGQGFTR